LSQNIIFGKFYLTLKKVLLHILLVFIFFQSFSQANTWSVKFSNAILSRDTPTINKLTSKGWEYSNSIVLRGIENVYNYTGNANYLNYIKAYVDSYVDASGNVTGLATALDNIHPAILCLFLYQQTRLIKYKIAATNVRNYLLTNTGFHKTPDGGYWHKNDGTYNNIMLLDGIYMAHTFLSEYGAMFNDTVAMDTAVDQALLLASHVYNSTTHLLKHAWDYSRLQVWANLATGASSETWSRGTGWYIAAIVDILQYLSPTHPRYNELKTLLNDLVIGIKNTQDPTTGLWYQVMDKQDSSKNYLETSGSGLMVYALKTAVNNDWIDTSYLSVARKGWQGLQTEIATYTDGKPQIKSFAPAMGVQNNYTAYVSAPFTAVNCPTPAPATQNPHGYCGLMLAASVMEFPITAYTFTGNGNWSDATNWDNNTLPPATLAAGNEIIINPVTGGQCILDVAQTISNGAVINVKAGKNFIVNGNLTIQ
jgi:unsaturated rhamnogalacturonyl hydrolase